MKQQKPYSILAYHGLEPEHLKNQRPQDAYSVREQDFREQMALVAEEGFITLTTADIIGRFRNRSDNRTLGITFDDGYAPVYEVGFPILKEFDLNAIVFVISGFIGQKGYLSKGQILELAESGMDIQSHSVTHPRLPHLTEREIEEELSVSKKTLEDLIGKAVNGFAVPGGSYDRRVCDIARNCGYEAIYTSDPGINRSRDRQMRLRRLMVRGTDNMAVFRSLASGERSIILRRQCEALGSSTIKSILGAPAYGKFKRLLGR